MRKGRPKQTTDYLVKLSVFLDSIKVKLFEIYLDLKLSNEEISVARIKDIYLGKDDTNYTLLGVIDMAKEKFAEELAPGSIKNYYTTRAYVEMFCKTRYKTGDVRLEHLTYNSYGVLAWYLLFARQFKEAELAADKGVKLDGSVNWIRLNLAHALLFQDKYEGALAIYQPLKDATDENGKSYVALCFKDLYALERAGIVHKDVSKVRTDLKK